MVAEEIKAFYRNKNVLVTGGAGFIGSHLVERLVQYGARVTILDNFSTGALKNLTSVINQITVLYADVSNEFSTYKATRNKDIVFHLAAITSVTQSVKNPQLCQKVNVQGTQNILEGCKQNGVTTVLYSSSSAVYGNQEGACTEESPTSPESPYATSKLAGELLCKKYVHDHGIQIACLRYFNVYGERQNPHGDYAAVVARFKYALQNNLPLVIFGDGKQTRDFIHVSHIVNTNVTLGARRNLNGDIFNVGSGKSMTLLELIEQLEIELHRKATEITFQPARSADITHSCASCEKIWNFTRNINSQTSF